MTEAERPDGEQLGEARLVEVLKRRADGNAQGLVRAIVEAAVEFSGGDQ